MWPVRLISLVFLFLAPIESNALRNPILPGWNPDPSIVRVGADYFIATSTFEYFPGHPIYHSRNLAEWTLVGHALSRASQLDLLGTPPDAGIWAPTLRYHDGVFYLATTARYVYTAELRLFPRSFYVTTTDIFANEWSDPIYFDFLGYDPDIFWDVNGDGYATWSGINNAVEKVYGIWQSKIDIQTGDSLTEAALIFNGTLPLNPASRPEGPHVYRINSTYYLMIAEGGTGPDHRSTIQRSIVSASGPWENNPANPILYNGADQTLPVQATGHADFVQAEDGNWWGTALGVRPHGQNSSHEQLGRETFLYPVTWEDGWPVINYGKPLSEHIPDVLFDVVRTPLYLNDFEHPELDNSFYYLRTPQKPFHSLTVNPGSLRMYGNAYTIGDRDSPALLLRKQTSYKETFETQLTFQPTSNLTQAGITVFYSDYLHNEIGVTGNGDARFVFTRTTELAKQVGPWALTPVNSTVVTTTYTPLESTSGPITLVIEAPPTYHSLGYSERNGANVTVLTTFDSAALTLPPAGAFFFKGAAFGMFSTGKGRPSVKAPADFAYWKQTSY